MVQGLHRESDTVVTKVDTPDNKSKLGQCVSRTVRQYLSDLGPTPCRDGLHALVIREVETELLREVMEWHKGNQSRAAATLGINRATLRKKLTAYQLL